jgi:hypothetical protein
MSRKPLRATDRRKGKVRDPQKESSTGSANPLASLFNDRRHPNGSGKRAH